MNITCNPSRHPQEQRRPPTSTNRSPRSSANAGTSIILGSSRTSSLGHSQTHFFTFKLLCFCVLVLANLRYARFIFDGSYSLNIYLYTAMITAYASDPSHFSFAIRLIRHLTRSGSPMPNHFIYPHVLKACGKAFEIGAVLAQVMKYDFGRFPSVETVIVDSYARTESNCTRGV